MLFSPHRYLFITGWVLLFSLIFMNTGCPESKETSATKSHSTSSPTEPVPGISAGEETVIEPMYPEQPTEPQPATTPEKPTEPQPATTPEQPTEPQPATTPEKPTEPQPATTPEQPTEPQPATTPEKQTEQPAEQPSEPVSQMTQLNAKYAAQVAPQELKLPQVADLEGQVEYYISKMEKTLEDLDGTNDFASDSEALHREGSTLTLIALALGISEQPSKFKDAAPGIIEATLKLEKVKTLDDATKIVAEIKKSTASKGDPGTLQWKKIVGLKPMMKAVPSINTLLKQNLRREASLKKGCQKVIEGTATMVVIGQASLLNADETGKPDAAKEWKEHCIQFRDAALAINQKARDFEKEKASFNDVEAAFDTLTESCNACHKIFFKDAEK